MRFAVFVFRSNRKLSIMVAFPSCLGALVRRKFSGALIPAHIRRPANLVLGQDS